MIDTADTAGSKAPAPASRGPVLDRRSLTRLTVIVVLLLLALFALPPLLDLAGIGHRSPVKAG